MEIYGLIGYPLGHSFSRKYFTEKFRREGIDADYRLFPIPVIGGMKKLIESTPGLKGFNVTIPYKEQVIPHLDNLSPAARAIGAVNVVKIVNGRLLGYNTDFIGFTESLRPLLRDDISNALVLGSGGASKAVVHGLMSLGITPAVVSRNPGGGMLGYNDLTEDVMALNKLIINTTPLGMWPSVGDAPPIPYGHISPAHICYDLIYNPEVTEFMNRAQKRGATVMNGLEMLHLQADHAWRIWQE